MATTLFLLNTAPDTHLGTDETRLAGSNGGWNVRALGTARGSGVVASSASSTAAGPTAGIEVQADVAGVCQWISPPVSADVTISGAITGNIWAEENNMSANVAINFRVQVIRANTTTTRNSNTLVDIVTSARTTELAFGGARTVNNFTATPGAGVVVNRGDRLLVTVFGDDAGTMASGFTFDIGYNGTTGAADGDTFLTFTETFAFESAPAGTQLFLTNVQSGLTGAPALISDFTGADENPLSEGGNWANLNSSGSALQRISSAASGSAAALCFSYWTPANFGPDLEAYFTISTVFQSYGIAFRIQGEGGANTWDGYLCDVEAGVAHIYSCTNATFTNLITGSGITWASGDKFGVRCEGSTIQIWRQASGSSDWNLHLTAVDTTYSAAGKIGLHANNTTQRIDDFYAATDSNLFTQQAWTSRGAGVVSYRSDTDAGWVAPLYTQDWYTKQLTAFTLTGLAQGNIRALESNASANASMRLEISVVDSDGTNPTVWSTWCIAPTGTDNGELTTSEVARTANCSGDDLSVTDGQRLRFRLYLDDISFAAMGNAFNVQPFFNGTSGGASGDSYVTLAQSVTEFVSGGVDDVLMKAMQAVNRASVW